MATFTQRLLRNKSAELSAKPDDWTKAGYDFLGWSEDSNATTASYDDKGTYAFSKDTTLYAVWKALNWRISYDMNQHGSAPSSAKTSYTADDLPYCPPSPDDVKATADNPVGYVFNIWSPLGIQVGETGNKTFTANWAQIDESNPGYITVFILDTSGSMFSDSNNPKDFINSVTTMLLAQKEYLCKVNAFSKVLVYTGTFVDNIYSSGEIASLNGATLNYPGDTTFWNLIWENTISNMENLGGSEAMLACSYFAINDVIKKYIETQNFKIGQSQIKGITFIVLSDESVMVGSDTLRGYGSLIDGTNWISRWQSVTGDSQHKHYGVQLPHTEYDRIANFREANARTITKALKQISHYYGINMQLGLSEWVQNSQELTAVALDDSASSHPRLVPCINKCNRTSDGSLITGGNMDTVQVLPETTSVASFDKLKQYRADNVILTKRESASTWTVAADSVSPVEEMSRISYCNVRFESWKIMRSEDLYSPDNVNKVHSVDGQYFQFKFSNEKVKLPVVTDVAGDYKISGWRQIYPTNSGTTLAPGAQVQASGDMVFSAVYSSDANPARIGNMIISQPAVYGEEFVAEANGWMNTLDAGGSVIDNAPKWLAYGNGIWYKNQPGCDVSEICSRLNSETNPDNLFFYNPNGNEQAYTNTNHQDTLYPISQLVGVGGIGLTKITVQPGTSTLITKILFSPHASCVCTTAKGTASEITIKDDNTCFATAIAPGKHSSILFIGGTFTATMVLSNGVSISAKASSVADNFRINRTSLGNARGCWYYQEKDQSGDVQDVDDIEKEILTFDFAEQLCAQPPGVTTSYITFRTTGLYQGNYPNSSRQWVDTLLINGMQVFKKR